MDNYSIQTVIQDNNVNLVSQVVGVPQLQTILEQNDVNITSIVNEPWVEVTSVNGMTGDVIVEPIIQAFQPNHYYLAGTAITYNGMLYYAKNTFTSGATFDVSDWDSPSFAQVQSDWNELDPLSKAFIQNKPTLADIATSGEYLDLLNSPNVSVYNWRATSTTTTTTTRTLFTYNSHTTNTGRMLFWCNLPIYTSQYTAWGRLNVNSTNISQVATNWTSSNGSQVFLAGKTTATVGSNPEIEVVLGAQSGATATLTTYNDVQLIIIDY